MLGLQTHNLKVVGLIDSRSHWHAFNLGQVDLLQLPHPSNEMESQCSLYRVSKQATSGL